MQGMQIHLRSYICLLSLLFLHLIQSSGTLTESARVCHFDDRLVCIDFIFYPTLLQQTYGGVMKRDF